MGVNKKIMSYKRVKDMPRRQQKAVFSKIKPNAIAKSSTKSDIKRIHHSGYSADTSKNDYDVYRRDLVQHMDKEEVKQYHKQKRKELKKESKLDKKQEKEELDSQNNQQTQNTDVTSE